VFEKPKEITAVFKSRGFKGAGLEKCLQTARTEVAAVGGGGVNWARVGGERSNLPDPSFGRPKFAAAKRGGGEGNKKDDKKTKKTIDIAKKTVDAGKDELQQSGAARSSNAGIDANGSGSSLNPLSS
jgi:hypothetical protein